MRAGAGTLLDIVRKLDFPDGRINIKIDDENFITTISSGKSVFKIQAKNRKQRDRKSVV